MTLKARILQPALPYMTAAALVVGLGSATFVHAQTVKQGNKTYKTIGEVKADLNQERTQWSVIDGHLAPGYESSAVWRIETFEMPDQADVQKQMREAMGSGQLGEEELKQMELMLKMLEEAGPLVEAMQGMGLGDMAAQENISIDITAFKPNEKDPFDVGRLTMHAGLAADVDPNDTPLHAYDVDIYYVIEGGNTLFMPEVAYWSDDSPEFDEPQITFTKLELNPDGSSRAQGHFKATLCRWEKAKMMQGVNTDDCMPIEGGFDTPLVFVKD